MEDALVQGNSVYKGTKTLFSLNPCFNGRCTRTRHLQRFVEEACVLILVLMEDALVHHSKDGWFHIPKVLILVLMEDALVQTQSRGRRVFRSES